MALFFQRDATLRVFPNEADGSFPPDSMAFDIPLLEGFSFSQSTNASEITLSEMESTAGTSRRGRKAFNDSLAPVEWSFSTYLRPYIASNTTVTGTSWGDAKQHLVDEVLWNALLAKKRVNEVQGVTAVTFSSGGTGHSVDDTLTFTGGTLRDTGSHATAVVASVSGGAIATITMVTAGDYLVAPTGVTPETGSGQVISAVTMSEGTDAVSARTAAVLTMNSSQSNSAALNTMTLEFNVGGSTVYKLNKAVVNSATVNFDVEGICTVEWSGMAATITGATAFTTANVTDALGANGGIAVSEGGRAQDTENFIRNRLTAMSVIPKTSGASAGVTEIVNAGYDLTLTGGSISIENNIAYLTPEELGIVNRPIEHVTGVRNIGGSFTCYLATSDPAGTGSKDFYEDLTSSNALDVITHDFGMIFKIGGATGSPRVEFEMPQSHVEVPTHSIEDVISLESTFTSIQSDLESNTPDDLTIRSYGVALA